jgi:ribonuclease BN (tRNA processing enzyme)
MKVTILGSGTGIPSLQRNAAGYLLEEDGQQCLIDCGSGTLLRLERARKSHRNIDAVFLTHTHVDHIGDLMPLLHALKLPGAPRKKPLSIMGPPGFPEFFQRYVEPVVGLPRGIEVHVLEARQLNDWNGIGMRTVDTVHSQRMNSIAYRFEAHGRAVVFSGDCDEDPGIVALARGADLLILDCSTLDVGKVAGHLSAGECGRVAAEADVARVVLTHFYPIIGADEQRAQECRRCYRGDIVLAEDLMELEV